MPIDLPVRRPTRADRSLKEVSVVLHLRALVFSPVTSEFAAVFGRFSVVLE
jgi:hypothetical protein